MKKSIFSVFLFLAVAMDVAAQGPPIFTDTPIMLGLEGRGVRTFGNIVSMENANAYIHPVAFPYNITNKWQVGVVAPFVAKSPNGMDSRSGFGDLQVFTKYQLFQKDGKAKTFRGLLKLTEVFPTGNTSETPTLGTGANQTSLSLVTGYVTTKYGLYTEVGYNATSDNLPDNVIYKLAFGYPLLPQKYPPQQVNIFAELLGNYVLDGVGNNLFFAPGIQYIVGRKLLFESGIQLPLDDPAPEGQKTNYIIRIGTRVLLF
ncbi:transporter [Ekhidna sp.]|uniref:transporter n=1 Tax=Ekhidna sp. TaxID=2608089 RepID=UPI003CCBEEB4